MCRGIFLTIHATAYLIISWEFDFQNDRMKKSRPPQSRNWASLQTGLQELICLRTRFLFDFPRRAESTEWWILLPLVPQPQTNDKTMKNIKLTQIMSSHEPSSVVIFIEFQSEQNCPCPCYRTWAGGASAGVFSSSTAAPKSTQWNKQIEDSDNPLTPCKGIFGSIRESYEK